MGSQEDFTKALISAFKDPAVVQTLKDNICGELKPEIISLTNLVSCLRKELSAKDEKINQLQSRIESLEEAADTQEQYSRRNSLRISGVPDAGFEDTGETVLTIANHIMKLDPPLEIQEVDRVHRVGPATSNTRQILVKFATYRSRQRMYKAKKNLRLPTNTTEGASRWSSSPWASRTPSQPKIFINEDLTKKRSHLLWEARKLKKEGKISDCWSHDGSVLIKNKINKIVPIRNLAQLATEST